MVLIGKKVNANDAKELGIVDKTAPEASVLSSAIELATEFAMKSSKRQEFGILKNSTYKHVVEALNKTPKFQEAKL